MKNKMVMGARLLLGLMFLVFGLNGFLQFMPTPPPTAEAGALLGAFAKTGYFFPFIKMTELLVGLMLLSNFFVPLALAVIFPIIVGIFQIHLFLDPGGMAIITLFALLHGFVTIGYWEYFRSVVTTRAELELDAA